MSLGSTHHPSIPVSNTPILPGTKVRATKVPTCETFPWIHTHTHTQTRSSLLRQYTIKKPCVLWVAAVFPFVVPEHGGSWFCLASDISRMSETLSITNSPTPNHQLKVQIPANTEGLRAHTEALLLHHTAIILPRDSRSYLSRAASFDSGTLRNAMHR